MMASYRKNIRTIENCYPDQSPSVLVLTKVSRDYMMM